VEAVEALTIVLAVGTTRGWRSTWEGVAAGFDGRIYGELGDGTVDIAAGKFSNAVVALKSKTLELSDYYIPTNARWIDRKDLDMGNVSPVIFPFKNWELVAGSGKEGVIYLLDAKSMGGADHRTPLYRSPLLANEDVNLAGRGFWGAFATWEDPQGVRWLYAPALGPPHSKAPAFPITNGAAAHGSIMAFNVNMDFASKKPVLKPAWISGDFNLPDPVVVANGVVFALSTGENANQVADRSQNTRPAVLYALDAKTGRVLQEERLPALGNYYASPVAGDKKVYFASEPGVVSVLADSPAELTAVIW